MFPGTHSRCLLLLLAILTTLMLTIAACGGGDDGDNGGGNGDDVTNGSGADGNGDEGGGNSEDRGSGDGDGGDEGDGESGDGEDGGSEEDAPEFSEISSDWEDIEATITYELETVDDQGETNNSTITYYSLPPNSRTDLEEDGELTSFIQQDGASYVCVDKQCLSYPGSDALNPIPFFSTSAAPEALALYASVAGFDSDSGEEDIAGLSATCYSVDQDGSEIGWCFSQDGILLRSFSQADGAEFEMRAIEISSDASASDFEPPYPVATLPPIGDINQ